MLVAQHQFENSLSTKFKEMAKILQPYELAVVHADVEVHETRLDIFYSLERLDATIDDIFGRVQQRIQLERTRLDQINNRISTCHTKVNSIRGSKKATTVFSTSKFPAPRKLPAYPTLFSQETSMSPSYREPKDGENYYPPDVSKSVVGNDTATAENLLLLTRINTHGSDMERVEFVMEDEGLGPVPMKIDYVGSLLLFNSAVNPYKNYTTLDNLVSSGRGAKDDVTIMKGLASAPATMLNGDLLPDIHGLDLTFKPEMGQMASLALPSNLPLDFLADINYEGAALPSIAPSAAKANFTLPQITDGGYKPSPSATQPNNAGLPPPSPAAAVQTTSAAQVTPASRPPPPPPPNAPPPPPPPPAVTLAPQAKPAAPVPAPMDPTPPRPPPPAPPAAVAKREEESDDDDDESPQGGSRGGLLDAIKGMSVNKLRKATEREVKTKKAEVASNKPMSMMDDLQARMQRRNSALSGKDSKQAIRRESLAVESAAARAEATLPMPGIPAPPGKSSQKPSVPFPPGKDAQKPIPPTQPPAPKTKSTLLSLGFAKVDEDAGNSDNEPPMPAASRSRYAQETDSSDESSISDVSDVSFDAAAKSKQEVKPPIPAPVPKPVPMPVPIAAPSAAPMGAARRGSLLDETNAGLSAMLAHGKSKETEKADSDDDDWD